MHLVRVISDVRLLMVDQLESDNDENTVKSTSQLRKDSEKFFSFLNGERGHARYITPNRNGTLVGEESLSSLIMKWNRVRGNEILCVFTSLVNREAHKTSLISRGMT